MKEINKKKNMIDTICLLIPLARLKNQSDAHYLAFSGPHKQIIRARKNDINTGIYSPKITILRDHFYPDPVVKIEFSIPKLIFGNNLEEVTDEDFDRIIHELQKRLFCHGVQVEESVLASASVAFVHYSKNILLKNGYTASYLISELSKVNYPKRFDASRTRYQNDGSALYIHNKSHEFVIYDKIADLRKIRNRSVKDEFLITKLQDDHREILRFEIRFCKKKKLNSFFEKIGRNREPTFRDVFDRDLSKEIITHYWKNIIRTKENGLFNIRGDPMQMLRELRRVNPDAKPSQNLYLAGILLLSRTEGGLGELREAVSSGDRGWQRIMADYKDITERLGEIPRDWVHQIENALSNFESVTNLVTEDLT